MDPFDGRKPMSPSVAVVGAGMGGLAAAVALSNRPRWDVTVLEATERPGGKVGVQTHDGVEFDTGPSLFTLPGIVRDLLEERGIDADDALQLFRPDPTTRYHFHNGPPLDIAPSVEGTTQHVRRTLGEDAGDQFAEFLDYARTIWQAASPHFVFDSAPTTLSAVKLGVSKMRDLMKIDSMKTMVESVDKRISDPRLRTLFLRYASFHGSDPRKAPATLHCIGWVDLGLGGWGVEGGMYQLVRTLEHIAKDGGVRFRYDTPVRAIQPTDDHFELHFQGGRMESDFVIVNADARHFAETLWDGDDHGLKLKSCASASGWTAVVKARRRPPEQRPAHTVVFPDRDYLEEYVDLFDRRLPPQQPTIYLCAREKAHRARGWDDHEPLFVMTQAPPVDRKNAGFDWAEYETRVLTRLRQKDLIEPGDTVVWRRTPAELADQYPDTRGSIYGMASNSRLAAFRRPPNCLPGYDGIYLASGSAHPGGGVPLALQSGRQAVAELLASRH